MCIIHQHPASDSEEVHRQALAYLHRKCIQLLCAEASQTANRLRTPAS